MSCVHYKFSSKLEHNIVPFTGLHITLTELKKKIMAKERLKSRHCDLQITNAQTLEEYLDDEVHIPRFSSVIVRRLPISKTTVMESFRAVCKTISKTLILSHLTHSIISSSFLLPGQFYRTSCSHTSRLIFYVCLVSRLCVLLTKCYSRFVHFLNGSRHFWLNDMGLK
uniref:DWNN domain-containing protein n=1 Tax=Gouania willdenowi TaxID=441366 RepID=A0A8C5D0G1_GOUWI